MKKITISGHDVFGIVVSIIIWYGFFIVYTCLDFIFPTLLFGIKLIYVFFVTVIGSILFYVSYRFNILITDTELIFKKKFLFITYYKYPLLIKDLEIQYPDTGFPINTKKKYVLKKGEPEWNLYDEGDSITLYENKKEVVSFGKKKYSDDIMIKIMEALQEINKNSRSSFLE